MWVYIHVCVYCLHVHPHPARPPGVCALSRAHTCLSWWIYKQQHLMMMCNLCTEYILIYIYIYIGPMEYFVWVYQTLRNSPPPPHFAASVREGMGLRAISSIAYKLPIIAKLSGKWENCRVIRGREVFGSGTWAQQGQTLQSPLLVICRPDGVTQTPSLFERSLPSPSAIWCKLNGLYRVWWGWSYNCDDGPALKTSHRVWISEEFQSWA